MLGPDNPYIRAFNQAPSRGALDGGVRGILAIHPWLCTGRQEIIFCRKRLHASWEDTKWWEGLDRGAAKFLRSATPTLGDLVNHTQEWHRSVLSPSARSSFTVDMACANLTAQESVRREYSTGKDTGPYGRISISKPDNVAWILYKNFSSLSLFLVGLNHHKKIRQLNKLMADYGANFLAGCETCTDWRFVSDKGDRFCNLFGNGFPSRGVCASNINDGKVKRDQWGGTCISSVGWISSFVTEVGVDTSGLGRSSVNQKNVLLKLISVEKFLLDLA
jgi:hypothetical protein